MSQKSNRLKNRLRIESERATKELKRVADANRHIAIESARIADERKSLNRSVALRMRVDRDFTRPVGDAFGLNIVFYPQEFRLAALGDRSGCGIDNISYFARSRGHEAGMKIADVIQRCLTGELSEFEKAS